MLKKMKRIAMTALLAEAELQYYDELGIAAITAYLRSIGYEVLLSCFYQKDLDYSKILSFKPDIIGITMYNFYKKQTYSLCDDLKKLLPDTLICAGGYLPTIAEEEVLQECDSVDFIIRGEGEYSFSKLLETLESQGDLSTVKGLGYRDGNSIILNEIDEVVQNLDDLPFPARDMLEENKFEVAAISSSRGCTSRCAFCSTQHMYKKWRGRSAENVVDEIDELMRTHGIDKYYFADCSFEDPGPDLSRMKQIAEKILERELNISYLADFRAEISRKLDEETISLLKKSGLRCVFIGIEAANEEDLILYRKRAKVDDNHNILIKLKQNNIYTNIGFINFNPYSTLKGLHKNIDFLEQYGFASRIDLIRIKCFVYKGNLLYNKIVKDKLILSDGRDGVNYRFYNKEIEALFNFVDRYVNYVEIKSDHALDKVGQLNYIHFRSLIYLKDYVEKRGDDEAYRIVSDYINNIKGVVEEANTIIAHWFRELLNLAQTKWDNKAAETISGELLNYKVSAGLAKKLMDLYKNMQDQVLGVSPQYKEILSNIY